MGEMGLPSGWDPRETMQVDDLGPSTQAEPAERIRKWRRWDFEEEKLLAAAVQKHGTKNWELVAKEMNTDRSPRMLYERWNERSRDIMAILENRTPPPPKPEKASRKEKRARQSAPVSEQEVEPGMDLPPNLIEPPHYFMMRTLNTKAHDLVAANRQTVSQAGERYATKGEWLREVLLGGDLGSEESRRGQDVAASVGALLGMASSAQMCKLASEPITESLLAPSKPRASQGADGELGMGEARRVTDESKISEARGFIQKIVAAGGGIEL